MKVGRNDLCPCGSGKKYKHCCLNKQGTYMKDGASEKVAIRNIVKEKGYSDNIADVLCNLMSYMKAQQWIGACHATTAVMFVVLSEFGYNPVSCIGEVKDDYMGYFDHSWIELDGQIIDLACSMTLLDGRPANAPVILGIDSYTGGACDMEYGIYFRGLDANATYITSVSFGEYMDAYPNLKNGLWDIVGIILDKKIDISALRLKYGNTQWKYVCSKEV